jgi:hypothetical protein
MKKLARREFRAEAPDVCGPPIFPRRLWLLEGKFFLFESAVIQNIDSKK